MEIEGAESSFPIEYLSQDTCYQEFVRGMDSFSKCKYSDALKSFLICSQYKYPPSYLMLGRLYSHICFIGHNDLSKEYWFSLARKYYDFFY